MSKQGEELEESPGLDDSPKEWAKFYLEMDFSIVPVPRGEKGPSVHWKQYQERKPQPQEVAGWFGGSKSKKRNIGIVCGEVSRNLVVFDFDAKKKYEEFKEKFPDVEENTRVVRTSKGYHVYLRLSEIPSWLRSRKWEGENFEIKWNGTLVVAPPSMHPSGDQYTPVGAEEILEVKEVEDFFDELSDWLKNFGIRLKEQDRRKIRIDNVLNGVSEGRRNDSCLHLSVFLKRSGAERDRAKKVLDNWNRLNEPPLKKEELNRTLESAWKGPRRGNDDYGFYFAENPEKMRIDLIEDDEGLKPVVGKKPEEKQETGWRTIARQILDAREFVTAEDSERIYAYEDGVYEPRGEAVIKSRAQELFSRKITTSKRRQIVEYVKWETPVRREEFNNPKHLVNLKNGLLDPKTGEVKDHTPDYISTTQLPVEHDPEADCPFFEEWLKETVGGEQMDMVKQMMGCCLLKDYRYDTFFVLVGEGSNGKTTFLKILRKLLGKDNVSSESMQNLQNRFSAAELHGKLANLCGDMPGKKLKDTGMIKQLSGGDWVRAERKNQNPFNFENYATLIFAANKLPRSPEDTYALHRRIAIIDFPYKFKKRPDPDKPDEKKKENRGELLSKIEDELPGILNYALEGLKEVVEAGELTEVETVEDRAKKYKKASDSIWSFVNEKLEETPEEWVKRSEVYKEYSKYCRKNDFKPVRQNQFTQRLPEYITTFKGQVRTDDGRPRIWHDIKLSKSEVSQGSRVSQEGSIEHISISGSGLGREQKTMDDHSPDIYESTPSRDRGDACDKIKESSKEREEGLSQGEIVEKILNFYKEYGGPDWTVPRLLDPLAEYFEDLDRGGLKPYVLKLKKEGKITLRGDGEAEEGGGDSGGE